MSPFIDPSHAKIVITPRLYHFLKRKYGSIFKEKIIQRGSNATVLMDFIYPDITIPKSVGEFFFMDSRKASECPSSFNWLGTFSFKTVSDFISLIECLKSSKEITFFSFVGKESFNTDVITVYGYVEIVKFSRPLGFKNIFLSHCSVPQNVNIEYCFPRIKGHRSADVLDAQRHIFYNTPLKYRLMDPQLPGPIISFGKPRDSRFVF